MNVASTGGSGGGRSLGWVVAVAAVVALVAIGLLGRADEQPLPPFSPRSTDPDGAKALVELVESFDASVTVTDEQPPRAADVALALGWAIPQDDATIARWREWVTDGGTLVVTTWVDGLTPEPAFGNSGGGQGTGFGATGNVIGQGACDAEVLAPVERLETGLVVAGDGAWEVPPGAASCFGDGEEAFVTVSRLGAGRVVSIGSAQVFTNANLAAQDNAVLATQLLVAEEGASVAWLEYPEHAVDPESGVLDLMGAGVKLALLQAVLAFVVFAFVRGRRLGAPIEEPLPTQIAGSELVDAYGHLLAQSKDPNRSAQVLRADLCEQLARRFGGQADQPGVLAEVVSARTGVDLGRLLDALAGPPTDDNSALVRLAAEISSLRQEILYGTRT